MIGANATFVHEALGVGSFDRRLSLGLRLVSGAAAAAVLAFLAAIVDLGMAEGVASALGRLPTLLASVAAVHSMRRGNPVASLVLAGWAVVPAGTLTMVCLQRGWLPLHFWIEHAMQLTMTVEVVLWMFVLACRGQRHAQQLRDCTGRRQAAGGGAEPAFRGVRHQARVGATIGFALAPIDASHIPTLLRYADAAMYVGKQRGKNQVVRASAPTDDALVLSAAH